MSNALFNRIKNEIIGNGAMPISRYINHCLYDDDHGYYKTRTVFGQKGDFITAPEISQIFGELLGAWAINTWQNLGAPQSFDLIEMGPGRGALMFDMLRVFKTHPDFLSAANIHLVEVSPNLRKIQEEKLKPLGIKIEWHDKLEPILNRPFVLIANELLDALIFDQYVKTDKGWSKRLIGVENEQFVFTTGEEILDNTHLPKHANEQTMGSIFEHSLEREALIKTIAQKIKSHQGGALMIDYGPAQSGFGDTFQALKDNQYCDVLSHQGEADLTNHVDFERLLSIAQNQDINAHEIITQGEFLLRLGLLERAGQLGYGKDKTQQVQIQQAVERLAGNAPEKHQMGDLFKALILSPKKNTLAPFAN